MHTNRHIRLSYSVLLLNNFALEEVIVRDAVVPVWNNTDELDNTQIVSLAEHIIIRNGDIRNEKEKSIIFLR